MDRAADTAAILLLDPDRGVLVARAARALLDAGVDVIIDDRPDRAGVKFSDAELVGIPFRITIGKRGLATGTAELTDRATGETVSIPLDDVAKHVREAVSEAIAACDGCTLLPFRPHREFPPYYRAAEIGIWPTQESMSMLDAAACALPIIVNDTLIARERIEGNGITYRLNDADDLAEKIRWLSDPDRRRELGSTGARRMVELFSWGAIARQRLADYEAAVTSRRRSA